MWLTHGLIFSEAEQYASATNATTQEAQLLNEALGSSPKDAPSWKQVCRLSTSETSIEATRSGSASIGKATPSGEGITAARNALLQRTPGKGVALLKAVTDTTGAGDPYYGGFIAGRLRGLSTVQSCSPGSAAAANVTQKGCGRSHLHGL